MDTSQPLSFNTPFRHAYGPKSPLRLQFVRPDRTKQSFKDECDINVILKRFEATGQLEHVAKRAPSYGDVPALDFREAMDLVVKARADFAQLPSAIRDRFGNDPGQLLAFLEDPKNREEGVRLGILVAPEAAPSSGGTPPPLAEPKGS